MDELDRWLRTEEHLFNCVAYDEGQICCLEKEHKNRSTVTKLIKTDMGNEVIERLKTLKKTSHRGYCISKKHYWAKNSDRCSCDKKPYNLGIELAINEIRKERN